ncbi:MAG: hypothetical protein AAF800_10120 [Planctomycetota bacterium]
MVNPYAAPALAGNYVEAMTHTPKFFGRSFWSVGVLRMADAPASGAGVAAVAVIWVGAVWLGLRRRPWRSGWGWRWLGARRWG